MVESLWHGRTTRRWAFGLALVAILGALIVVLVAPRESPSTKGAGVPSAESSTPRDLPSISPTTTAKPKSAPLAKVPASIPPVTADYRALASAAAVAIYSWDTRSSSYSDVYARIRGWWFVLPDGSNPLAVLVQEFEATGINAGSFASLAGQGAYRVATFESMACDNELVKVRERPAPWAGLHVCTVRLKVIDQTVSSSNSYTAPVSVMANCPPAATAPPDRCQMVGFYASTSRIVY
ncbi:hypothetical protein DM793_12930 [Paenarthrobacter nitroguajacolicus]|uniref:hypothetical protein n=1 Tax=Paenarthrobacter nitroguajacolicus TaxID=211146 RepID=UPI0015C0CF12|nr:hypothetical protein [Paenarthrobacter nitroguajacolicus]NWL12186.1 hypothetical protein [Paenarthrobacter nitroguajacolicus]